MRLDEISGKVIPVVFALRQALPQPGTAPSPNFWTTRNIHPDIRKAAERLYSDGYFAQAVSEACKALDKMVAKASGIDETGANLMRTSFSPRKPILKFGTFKGSSSDNEQQGYMDLFAGTMIGIRNPRGHEAGYEDDQETCEDLLVLISHLAKKLSITRKIRRKKSA